MGLFIFLSSLKMNRIITDLHTDTDRVDNKVKASVKKVNELIDKMKGKLRK